METFIGAVFVFFMIWLFFEFPGLVFVAIFIFIGVKACGSTSVEITTNENEPAQTIEEPIEQPTKPPVIENSVKERCLDGIVYLLITEDGQSFMAPKEDTFGYNVKCSE